MGPQKLKHFKLPDGITSKNFYNTNKANPYYNWKFSLIDDVKVPAALEPGHYYISWRWDGSTVFQNFCNCGDVEITADGPSTPLPIPGSESIGGGSQHPTSAAEPEPEPEDEDDHKKPATEPEPEPEDEDDGKKPATEPEPEPEDEDDGKKGSKGASVKAAGGSRKKKSAAAARRAKAAARRAGRRSILQMSETDTLSLRETLKNVVDMADEETLRKLDDYLRKNSYQQQSHAYDPRSSETMMLKGGSISAVVRTNGEVELSDLGAP